MYLKLDSLPCFVFTDCLNLILRPIKSLHFSSTIQSPIHFTSVSVTVLRQLWAPQGRQQLKKQEHEQNNLATLLYDLQPNLIMSFHICAFFLLLLFFKKLENTFYIYWWRRNMTINQVYIVHSESEVQQRLKDRIRFGCRSFQEKYFFRNVNKKLTCRNNLFSKTYLWFTIFELD